MTPSDIVAVVTESNQRARGRPRKGDPESISALALRMIAADGWSATTMEAIALKADIGVATLFRYFPTKADLLWYGMEKSVRALQEAFEHRDPRAGIADAVFAAYTAMLRSPDVNLEIIRARVAIIANDQEASDATWAHYEQWRLIVTGLVAELRGEPRETPESRMLGSVLWAALWAAITLWAQSDEPEPDRLVNAARALLGDLG